MKPAGVEGGAAVYSVGSERQEFPLAKDGTVCTSIKVNAMDGNNHTC